MRDFIEFLWELPWLIKAVIVGLIILLGWGLTQPTCEELGGKTEFQYFMPMTVNNTTTMVPIYECVMPEHDGRPDDYPRH